MATAYVSAPIEVEAEAFEQMAYEYLQARIPGWEPAEGNLDVWLIQAFAQIAAQVAETASDVPTAIFRYYGANVVGLPPQDATAATGTVTFAARDTDGHAIPAGTTIGVQVDGTWHAFETSRDAEILAGTAAAAGVSVIAVETGSQGTGLGGSASPLDPLDWISSVAFDAPTTGGLDAEPDDEYLARLVSELALLTPRPILPEDFAVLALRVNGVDRAVALNGYDPADATWANERMVAVAVVDESGGKVSAETLAAVKNSLEALREVNFVVNVIDPTYTDVSVAFQVTVWPDFDTAAVVANVKSALAAYLSPANWGQPNYGERRAWVNEPKVRYLEVAQVVNGVEGVRYVESLTVNGGTADLALAGPAPLPKVPANGITGEAV